MNEPGKPVVGIVMGSDSDWPVMQAAAEALGSFGIAHEVDVVSAHRMPTEMITPSIATWKMRLPVSRR